MTQLSAHSDRQPFRRQVGSSQVWAGVADISITRPAGKEHSGSVATSAEGVRILCGTTLNYDHASIIVGNHVDREL
jgi:hypothetical protein